MDIMKSALGQMIEIDQRDAARHATALLLAKNGHLKQAIETARTIEDSELRDKALAQLAQ